MLTPVLQKQLDDIKTHYPGASIVPGPDGSLLVEIPGVQLDRAKWNQPSTTVWFLLPLGYPQAKPDCFWAEPNLRLSHGGMPTNTSFNTNSGAQRLWFSWHAQTWNPNIDSLRSYLSLIKSRLWDGR